MGNSCCEGRANKANPVPLVRKPTLISSKLKRDRGNVYKRAASTVAHTSHTPLHRTTTSPSTRHPKKRETHQPTPPLQSPDPTPLISLPTEPIITTPTNLPELPSFPVEDPVEETLGLSYTLDGGRDCSHSQQKQLLALFDSDEELDSLAPISLHHAKDLFDVLVLAISSKCLYLLETSDYSDVKRKIYLSCLRLLCVNSDRSAVVVVYQRGVEALEHVILSSTRFESLLKAILSVHFEEEGRIVPALTQPTLADALAYLSTLNFQSMAELTSREALRIQKLFATQGLIGENKLVMMQCLKEVQGKDRAVQLLVSDRALYTLSYSFFLIDRVALESVKAVRFEDSCHVCIEADAEHRFNLPNQQGQDLERTITAFLQRSVTV